MLEIDLSDDSRLSAVYQQLKLTVARTLQRHNIENSKQIFLEKESRRLSINFHIHVSVSDLYISQPVCLLCCRKYVHRSWRNYFSGNT
jgi:hypothetical protein